MLTRTVALVALLLLALPAWRSSAEAQTKVRFALDWQIQGPQAPFITAKALGAFAAQGLDVTIDRGTGSQKTIEQVATGTYDLGYGDINSMIEYNVKTPEADVVAFKYSDHGIDLYGNAVVARVDWLKANADTVRRFLAALNTGFKATLKDPTAAIAHIRAAEPLTNESTELKRLQL